MRWSDAFINSMDMSLSKFWELVEDRDARSAVAMGSSTTTISAPNRPEQLEEKETSPSSRQMELPPQHPTPAPRRQLSGNPCSFRAGGGGAEAELHILLQPWEKVSIQA